MPRAELAANDSRDFIAKDQRPPISPDLNLRTSGSNVENIMSSIEKKKKKKKKNRFSNQSVADLEEA
jgi:hypothetical protein